MDSKVVEVLGGQGYVRLIDFMGDETRIVNAARVSFGKRVDAIEEKDRVLIRYLINNQHTSPLEHVEFTFLVHCPLFIRGQWHRHRTWSYNEISRRYTEFDLQFYVPPKIRGQAKINRQASVDGFGEGEDHEEHIKSIMAKHNIGCLKLYQNLLDEGVAREQARGVLPQNMMVTFYATVDLHNLIHFINLRSHEGAQWEMVQYAEALKQLIKPIVPTVYEAKWGIIERFEAIEEATYGTKPDGKRYYNVRGPDGKFTQP